MVRKSDVRQELPASGRPGTSNQQTVGPQARDVAVKGRQARAARTSQLSRSSSEVTTCENIVATIRTPHRARTDDYVSIRLKARAAWRVITWRNV